jgi:hypothetical protein
MKRCGVFLALAITLVTASFADELPHVCVITQAEDTVGERLVYNVKELIRKSHAMKFMPSERETNCLRLIINTIELEERPTRGMSTVFSVTWVAALGTHEEGYIDSTVGYCGSKRVTETAESIVARTERLVSSLTLPRSN